MTGVRIEIDDAEVRSALALLAANGDDLAPAMEEIGAMLVASTLNRFETETGPDGRRWPPSARALAESGRTLTDRGHLRDSITYAAGPTSVEVGTNLVYAAIHQLGGRTPPMTIRPTRKRALAWPGGRHPVAKVEHPGSEIPARPFLGIDADDEAAIVAILGEHILGGIG